MLSVHFGEPSFTFNWNSKPLSGLDLSFPCYIASQQDSRLLGDAALTHGS